jgi:hypothetical protein
MQVLKYLRISVCPEDNSSEFIPWDVMPFSLVDLLLPVTVYKSLLILMETADPSKTLISTLSSLFQ